MADVEKVKELRRRTAAGIMDCRKALAYSDGDVGKAEKIIWRQRVRDGLDLADKPASGRGGIVHAYIHHGGRIGAMVEVLCDTDFAARTDELKTFAHDLAMHVAAEKPEWLQVCDIHPADFIGLSKDGLEQRCLLTQPHIKDPACTVGEMLAQLSARTGENCRIGRFERWEIGDRRGIAQDAHRSVVPSGWNGRTAGAGLYWCLFVVAFIAIIALITWFK